MPSLRSISDYVKTTVSRDHSPLLSDRDGTEIRISAGPSATYNNRSRLFTDFSEHLVLNDKFKDKHPKKETDNTRNSLRRTLEDERQKYCQANRGYYLDTCEASVATHQHNLQAAIRQAVDKEGTGTVVSIVPPTDIDSVSELDGQPRRELFPATRDEHCCCPTHFTGQRVSEWMEFAGWKPVTRLCDGPDGKTVQTDLWSYRPSVFEKGEELPRHMVDGINKSLKVQNDLVTNAWVRRRSLQAMRQSLSSLQGD
jgi:hypothetical protein